MLLKDKVEIIKRYLIKDSRGYFLKVLTGTEQGLPDKTGEIYITMAYPNERRGGHYHTKATEYFTIIRGEAVLNLKDVYTNEIMDVHLESENPCTVIVPPNIAHVFCNDSGGEFVLVAYSDKLYDPKDTTPFNFDGKF
ncbi:MAG: WxcM-like domain-containing protein [Bacteroidales bacterium]